MDCMQFRQADNRDAEAVRKLIFDVLAEYDLLAEHDGVDSDLADLEGNYIKSGGLFEVIEDDDGTLIGTLGLFRKTQDVCELRKMYLLRTARGRGLGKQMMDRAISAARELGFSRIELETAGALVEAIGLYRRYGFEPINPDHLCARCDRAFALDL